MPSISLPRTRIRLGACAALAGTSFATDAPLWSTTALLLPCAAIPLAVAVQGGPRLLRALVFPRRPRQARRPPPERMSTDDQNQPAHGVATTIG